ncbi:MAG: SDR family oxidoreductase [Clostridiales bacterium]|nr:SDR family oxidoreductase [Clostridiales bacterium]
MAVTIVTGGSRGIGRAVVEAFAARGDRVFFLYEKEHGAARRVSAQTGATALCCDVADGEQVRQAFRTLPPADNLILCAGICRYGLMQDLPEAEWDRLFDVNVKGIYHCVNAAVPGFLQTHRGNIVTVSSMWGRVGASCEAAYSATKGAVIALTKALAKELGPSGIRVNCVAPGVILTDMCGSVEPQVLAQMAEETPLGRNGQPEDVARAILLLTESGFVTGTVLNVDGGYAI